VLGFLFTCRWLVNLLYECPYWVADVLAGLLGLGLLGGCGESFFSYPYDLPNCFLFTLTLAAMLARRWWFVLPFAAVAFSKETSVLLVLAYLLVADNRRSARFVGELGLMVAVYLGARLLIDSAYPSRPGTVWGGFWYPDRNVRMLAMYAVPFAWLVPVVAIGLARLARHWRKYPARFRRLALLAVPLLGMGFLIGWLEEKRQYLEVYPVLALLVAQGLLLELGLGRLLMPRPEVRPAEPPAQALSSRVVVDPIRAPVFSPRPLASRPTRDTPKPGRG
jgi:hypothetical protein